MQDDQKMVAFQLPLETYTRLQELSIKHFRTISAEIRAIISSYIATIDSNVEDTDSGELSL